MHHQLRSLRPLTFLSLASLALLSLSAQANVIVDTQGVDMERYHADRYECEQLSQQVEHQQTDSLGHDALRSTGKGALLGAAGGAIAGGSGSKGAKIGAGVGLVSGALHHSAEKREAQQEYSFEQQQVVRNCLINRGYQVLN
ncbi:glycine zipper family protein [Ferrimonas marina]|uniref:Glycine-zipper containing OmpA-like membrane domain-containing protein n=1 Tax=Ferrimonas marina TaxID=299255 RepID=A0A1M5R3E2_9GAMM|nr:glycine zipper family protein [Ferrimonas marina]SHH20852.1 Glycine-zipper containing OmpA-like membrane domain-containing protein [Ferrimonas marina]